MQASKKATLHIAMCLTNKPPFVKAQKPYWHRLKPQEQVQIQSWQMNYSWKLSKERWEDDAKEYVY